MTKCVPEVMPTLNDACFLMYVWKTVITFIIHVRFILFGQKPASVRNISINLWIAF